MSDRSHVIGKTDKAGISDVVLESAITTIMDCEDVPSPRSMPKTRLAPIATGWG